MYCEFNFSIILVTFFVNLKNTQAESMPLFPWLQYNVPVY